MERTSGNGLRPLRVLVSSYACKPDEGSEQGKGWNWIRQLSRFHQVWVITRATNREWIEPALAEEPLPNVHWIYFDLPGWSWLPSDLRELIFYYCWQLAAYPVAKKLHRQVGFDLVHHVTFARYWMPSVMALLPIPFVWGPVGGGESTPQAFRRSFGRRGKFYELMRDLARHLGELDPLVRLTARRAALALATTKDTEKRLRSLHSPAVKVFPAIGLSENDIRQLGRLPFRRQKPFRLLSCGRLLHWKGFHLCLQAFADLLKQFPESEYWIIGSGPELEPLRAQARILQVEEQVVFCHQLPRAEVFRKLEACDVVLHPSLHDSGGWVCLEAMAAGRPVVCFDWGGPGLLVTQEVGIKIPAFSPDQAVRDLQAALCQMAADPALRVRLGEAGRKRVQECFLWNRKVEWLNTIYCGVARSRSEREESPRERGAELSEVRVGAHFGESPARKSDAV